MTNTGPKVTFEDSGDRRYAAVTFPISSGEFAAVRFLDSENPSETNAAERSRVVAKAKSLLRDIGSA